MVFTFMDRTGVFSLHPQVRGRGGMDDIPCSDMLILHLFNQKGGQNTLFIEWCNFDHSRKDVLQSESDNDK